MTDPTLADPSSRARWNPARHQGFVAVLVAMAIVVGIDVTGGFGSAHGPLHTDPPTQIRGIEGKSIKVVYYLPPEDDPVTKIVASFLAPTDDSDKAVATVRGFMRAFESSPELKGWKVDLVVFTGSGNLLDSVAARADAVKIAEEIKPFIVWGGPLLGTAYADELASRGVMCVMCVTSGSNDFYASHAPYLWSLQTTPEQVGTHAAEYVKKRLAGRTAAFAGDESMTRSERRFGLLAMNGPFGGAGLSRSISTQLRDLGVTLTDEVEYTDSFAVKQVQATMIGRLKERGVTTVIYAGDPLAMRSFMREATDQRWFPEWIMVGAFSSERSTFGRQADPQQMRHAFGVTPLPMPIEGDFDLISGIYKMGNNGESPPAKESVLLIFAPMALFYAGLKNVVAAAPGDADAPGLITPQSMAKGMFDAPSIGGTPDNPVIPLIGFGNKGVWPYPDYSGIDDFAEIWWDVDREGNDEFGLPGRGMWQYSDGGARYLPGHWPDGPPHAFVREGARAVFSQ